MLRPGDLQILQERLVELPERWVNPLLLTVNICQTVQATLTGIVSAHLFGAWGVVVGVTLNVIVFFVLAGASLDLQSMAEIGWLGLAYIALRIVGRIGGGWIGAAVCQADRRTRAWIGLALLPQAGVALGMALVAAERCAAEESVLPDADALAAAKGRARARERVSAASGRSSPRG